MRFLGRLTRFGAHAALWQAVRSEAVVGPMWFLVRFLDAAGVVVRRWAPRRAGQYRVAGREIGIWILVFLWLAIPAVAVICRVILHVGP